MSNYISDKLDRVVSTLLKVQDKLREIENDGSYTMAFDEREFELFVIFNDRLRG